METKEWDIFISHAAEDKAAVARPLAAALKRAGARVWLDEHELTVGDSLTEKIDEGLVHSQFGVVILSPAFFAKHWPKRELAGLRAREEEGRKVILPVWHNIDKPAISQFSPILADALAANTEQGIDNVAEALIRVIFSSTEDDGGAPHRSVYRRLVEILESEPDKETFVEFLPFHKLDGYYLGWGGEPKIKKVELGDVVFDAYAQQQGHGMNLALVYFTEAWKDPFETSAEGDLKIREEVMDVISAIILTQQSLHDAMIRDSNVRKKVWNLFTPPETAGFEDRCEEAFNEYGPEKSFLLPRTQFFVYAGRRSEIDASSAKHNMWSELRVYYPGIYIKTYDSLLDAIRPD